MRRDFTLAASGLLLAAVVTWSAWSTCGFGRCPVVTRLTAYQPGRASVIVDRYGEPLADLAPAQRKVVPLRSLPPVVGEAFVAVEDQRFYEHHGVDWRRVAGASLANLRARAIDEGFSTIPMQLARNVFAAEIPAQERTLSRKLREIRVAREIEQSYDKQEILELYLNHIYFGNRAYGIEAAAQHYFGRPAAQLELTEAALLAALPKAPARYDPRAHPEAALARRNLVLSLMAAQGKISAGEAEAAKGVPVRLAVGRQTRDPGPAAHFVDQVRNELEERFGDSIYDEPVRVWTTLDPAIQLAAVEELERQLRAVENGAAGRFRAPRYTPAGETTENATPYLQGAVVVMSVADGDVLAWVGGRDYTHSKFDRAAQGRRQMGSAFKPFVYAAALGRGFHLSQQLLDEPLRVELPYGQVWEPRNFSGRYDGTVSLRQALVRSKNVATVRLAHAIGYDAVAEVARRVGMGEKLGELPSTALGAGGMSPLDLTAAYSAFAGAGRAVTPRRVLRVERLDGTPVWQSEPHAELVLDPRIAFLINDVLREALERGSGAAVRQAGFHGPAAGKTGTTNDGADAWFIGYLPDLVGGVWIGFDRPRPIAARATGGQLAAPVWGRMMKRIYAGRKLPRAWQPPDGVVVRRVDPETGLLMAAGCASRDGRSDREYFIAGSEPAEYCPGFDVPPPFVTGAPVLVVERPDPASDSRGDFALELAREEMGEAEGGLPEQPRAFIQLVASRRSAIAGDAPAADPSAAAARSHEFR